MVILNLIALLYVGKVHNVGKVQRTREAQDEEKMLPFCGKIIPHDCVQVL